MERLMTKCNGMKYFVIALLCFGLSPCLTLSNARCIYLHLAIPNKIPFLLLYVSIRI